MSGLGLLESVHKSLLSAPWLEPQRKRLCVWTQLRGACFLDALLEMWAWFAELRAPLLPPQLLSLLYTGAPVHRSCPATIGRRTAAVRATYRQSSLSTELASKQSLQQEGRPRWWVATKGRVKIREAEFDRTMGILYVDPVRVKEVEVNAAETGWRASWTRSTFGIDNSDERGEDTMKLKSLIVQAAIESSVKCHRNGVVSRCQQSPELSVAKTAYLWSVTGEASTVGEGVPRGPSVTEVLRGCHETYRIQQ